MPERTVSLNHTVRDPRDVPVKVMIFCGSGGKYSSYCTHCYCENFSCNLLKSVICEAQKYSSIQLKKRPMKKSS